LFFDPDPIFHPDADPDPTFHPDADPDPDPDPSFQKKAQLLEKVLIFHTYILACHLQIRYRIQLITLMRIRILIFI
jgi:hypothetical protein